MASTRRRVHACLSPSRAADQWQRKQVVITDLVSGLQDRLHGQIDVMVFNPPYVPSPPEEVSATHSLVSAHRGAPLITPRATVRRLAAVACAQPGLVATAAGK
jgi:hypothetical protein